MAGLLRPRHREAQVGEEPSSAPLADVPFGVLVGGGRSRPDDVEAELLPQPPKLVSGHERIVP